MSGARERFADAARDLAGLAGWHLGWSPDQFWRSTPAEMEAVVKAMLGPEGMSSAEGAPTRDEIARLQEMFPDG